MNPADVYAEAIFLGTGTSVGVPAIGCECDVCGSEDPKNNRTRCSVVFRLPGGNLLIDTPPELRIQLLREKIPLIHSVAYTHEHADHLFGLDDVRLFPFRLRAPVPIYAAEAVEKRIRHSYDYAFSTREITHPGARPQLEIRPIDPAQSFSTLGCEVVPIPMKHGPHFEVLGFRIGDFAYCTDTNEIPSASRDLIRGVHTFVVGALREREHPTHFNLEQAIEVARDIGATRTLITHVGHELDHEATNRRLPNGIDLAHDGLRVPVSLTRGQ